MRIEDQLNETLEACDIQRIAEEGIIHDAFGRIDHLESFLIDPPKTTCRKEAFTRCCIELFELGAKLQRVHDSRGVFERRNHLTGHPGF